MINITLVELRVRIGAEVASLLSPRPMLLRQVDFSSSGAKKISNEMYRLVQEKASKLPIILLLFTYPQDKKRIRRSTKKLRYRRQGKFGEKHINIEFSDSNSVGNTRRMKLVLWASKRKITK